MRSIPQPPRLALERIEDAETASVGSTAAKPGNATDLQISNHLHPNRFQVSVIQYE